MATPEIHPGKTAISRRTLSRPMRQAVADGLITPDHSVFDYGAGRGADVTLLEAAGVTAHGWDPYHAPDAPKEPADVVGLNFVLNVIADRKEREAALKEAVSLANHVAVVAVRTDIKQLNELKGAKPYSDGVLTNSNTFQHFYTNDEAAEYLSKETGLTAHQVEDGIFYLFTDPKMEKDFVAGWIAADADWADAVIAGKAPEAGQKAEAKRGTKRPSQTKLPSAAALREALDQAPVGKTLPEAFYIHQSALDTLPAAARAVVDHARAVAPDAPATLVKIARDGSAVSFLDYPTFDADPHPALAVSTRVATATGKVMHRSYEASQNAPILHRKESFVGEDYPGRDRFAALSAKEEAAGLLSRRDIGFQTQWAAALDEAGVKLRGHTLITPKAGWTATMTDGGDASAGAAAHTRRRTAPKPR